MKFSKIRHLLTSALLTALLLVTGSTCYATDLDNDGAISAAEKAQSPDTPTQLPLDGNEASINTITSPDYPDELVLDFKAQDLTSGVSYNIENLMVQDGHIYRFFFQFFSNGEEIDDVEVVLQHPESVNSEGNTYFQLIARDSTSAQSLLIAKIPVTVIGDTPLRMEYLEDSCLTTFCGSLSSAFNNSAEDLFDTQSGMELACISNRERYENSEYIPETIILDSQTTSETENMSENESEDRGTDETDIIVIMIIIVAIIMMVVFGFCFNAMCAEFSDLKAEVCKTLNQLKNASKSPSLDNSESSSTDKSSES